MAEKLIGKVANYFENIGVAVLKLDKPLKVGETIEIQGGEVEFEQVVDSMQIERESIKKAKKGDDVGLKVSEKVRSGYRVYKV